MPVSLYSSSSLLVYVWLFTTWGRAKKEEEQGSLMKLRLEL
jgi:hypothetical protein